MGGGQPEDCPCVPVGNVQNTSTQTLGGTSKERQRMGIPSWSFLSGDQEQENREAGFVPSAPEAREQKKGMKSCPKEETDTEQFHNRTQDTHFLKIDYGETNRRGEAQGIGPKNGARATLVPGVCY